MGDRSKHLVVVYQWWSRRLSPVMGCVCNCHKAFVASFLHVLTVVRVARRSVGIQRPGRPRRCEHGRHRRDSLVCERCMG